MKIINLEKDYPEAGDPNPALQGSDPQPAGQHGKVPKTILVSNRRAHPEEHKPDQHLEYVGRGRVAVGAAVQGGAPGELQDRPENKGGREGVRAPGGAERGPGYCYSQEEDFDSTTRFIREQGRAN